MSSNRQPSRVVALLVSLCAALAIATPASADPRYARDPDQKVDAWYGAQIAKYTTAPEFNTILTDYLPASDTVPTPAKVLNGDVAGAPNYLPYVADVHKYFRMLEAATPRVRVFTIGKSEEGREMIAVAIADEAVLAKLDENRARLAQLADPRVLAMDDKRAEELIADTVPVYYITAAIHSTETGSPTSTMELAYRLAVDEAPYIKEIRSKVITLITPVVETDGRDRMVDIYRWHRQHPDKQYPPLLYWGKYVAHDNNRDAMGLTLALTRNVLDTYVGWKAQVLHDLHESVPFLYDNTVGDGPYNAWVDPLLVNEWQQIGWDNVQELTRLGLPGVYTHGNFDTWSPGYLMFLAAMHNGISRLYETFGNGGADTVERQLDPDEYARTWYRPNPPYAKVLWSQRNNNNYTQSGLLTALSYFAKHDKQFLRNFWLKSKRSITKPTDGGPAAYVLPGDETRTPQQAALLRVLQLQHVEIHRATDAFTVQVPRASAAKDESDEDDDADAGDKADESDESADDTSDTVARTFPAGSIVIRMDQPYARAADVLLDRQYWAPDDPQKQPYDDTAWSLSEMYGAEVVRVVDLAVLKPAMTRVDAVHAATRGATGDGDTWLVDGRAGHTLLGLRFALPRADVRVATTAFTSTGREFPAGTLVIRDVTRDAIDAAAQRADLEAFAVDAAPDIALEKVSLPRIALMHTWTGTQTEGWWRMALDRAGVPYDYISTQDIAGFGDLRRRYDVILFGPADAGSTALIVDGLPRWGNAMPWKKTELTPNLGTPDATDDIRPGLGGDGVEALRRFVADGGLFVTSGDTSGFAIDVGLAPGVKLVDGSAARVVGSILSATRVDDNSAVMFGYADDFAVYSPDATTFSLSPQVVGGFSLPNAKNHKRPTGRGGPDEIDVPQARASQVIPPLASPEPWQAQQLTDEQRRNNWYAIPDAMQPRALLRFGVADGLLIGGLLGDAGVIAQRAIVVDARHGRGHTLLFGINPLWRGQTVGTYGLVFNAILHWDRLSAREDAAVARASR